jgi:hypothetical protein
MREGWVPFDPPQGIKRTLNVSCRIARDQQLIPVAMMPEGAILFRLIGSNNKKEIGCNLNGHFACRGEYDVGLCSEPSSQCAMTRRLRKSFAKLESHRIGDFESRSLLPTINPPCIQPPRDIVKCTDADSSAKSNKPFV